MDTDGVSMGAEPRDGVLGRWKVYVPDVDGPVVGGPVAEVVGVACDGKNRMWRRWNAERGGGGQHPGMDAGGRAPWGKGRAATGRGRQRIATLVAAEGLHNCYYRADVDLLYVSLHGAWLGRMAGQSTARLTPPIPALLKDKEN